MSVYVIEAVGTDRVKIGYTKLSEPDRRLGELSVASPFQLRLIVFIGGSNGCYRHEQNLHKRFAGARVNREWFRRTADIDDWINSLPAYWHVPKRVIVIHCVVCSKSWKSIKPAAGDEFCSIECYNRSMAGV